METVRENLSSVRQQYIRAHEFFQQIRAQLLTEYAFHPKNSVELRAKDHMIQDLRSKSHMYSEEMRVIKQGLRDMLSEIESLEDSNTTVPRTQDPWMAYECIDSDSNFALCTRARKILMGSVSKPQCGVLPTMTPFVFGPKGSEQELFGWEVVGLYHALVAGPLYMHERDMWDYLQQLQNTDDPLLICVSEMMEYMCPKSREEATQRHVTVPHAPSDWVNFRAHYDPECIQSKKEFQNSELLKKYMGQLVSIEKALMTGRERPFTPQKKWQREGPCSGQYFLRLDRLFHRFQYLQDDIQLLLDELGTSLTHDEYVASPTRRVYISGVHLDQMPSSIMYIKNMIEAHARMDPERCISDDTLKQLRALDTTKHVEWRALPCVSRYMPLLCSNTTIHTAVSIPRCAFANLVHAGYHH